jgi:molecular chaperone GrpE (heat shock protein)
MTTTAPKLNKLPFYIADAFLLSVAAWIVFKCPNPFQPWPLIALIVCAAAGAWVSIIPFLRQHEADVQFADSEKLTSAVEQINNLRTFTNQISFATAQWQVVQEQSAKTVTTAREIADRLNAESKEFTEFMQKANDSEKAHLRLEVEKMRRGEGEWLHVLVRVLDHVYALYLAGVESGQTNLIQQFSQFQNACRDAARRVGLTAFEARANDLYNEKTNQVANSQTPPHAGARIAQTIAPGFTFQGQMIRQAIVALHPPEPGGEGNKPLQGSVQHAAPAAESAEVEKTKPAAKPSGAQTPLLFDEQQ